MNFTANSLFHFILILIRITTFIMITPFWSNKSINSKTKIGLCCFIAYITSFGVKALEIIPDSLTGIIFLIVKQIFFGLVLGFSTRLFIDGIRTAYGILDIHIGFGFGKIMDPEMGIQSSILEFFYGIFTILILVCTDGHLIILRAILYSFQILPLNGNWGISTSLVSYLVLMSGEIFAIVLQLVGPIIAILFLIEFCMAIMAKMMPQINVFILSLPLKLAVGLICIIISFPLFPYKISIMVDRMAEQVLFITKSF